MRHEPSLLRTRHLQTGYRSGGKKIVVPGAIPELEVRAGQLICLLGPNGSGKSTLLRTLSGLQPPLEGVIEIAGSARMTPGELARNISLVLTDRIRGNNLTVYSLVALGRYPYSGWLGVLSEADRAAIDRAIGAAGIQALRDRKLNTLSDGESQKVMLSRALAQDTPLLLLDEPTAHLDLPSRIQLMRLLHELARQTGKGILLSTHELELALQVADEVWLLQGGGHFHKGAPEDLVLNGAFEAAFAKEGIHFDKNTGAFVIRQEQLRPVRFEGDGTAAYWTRRALQREGFAVSEDGTAPGLIRVAEDNGRVTWRLERESGTGEYDSISSLLQALREII